MSALFNQFASFIQYIYSSVQTVISFVQSALVWIGQEWVLVQGVSNLVLPSAFQVILAFLVAFMVVMLVVKVVIQLL